VDDSDGFVDDDEKPPAKTPCTASLSRTCDKHDAVTYVEAPVKLFATETSDRTETECQSQSISLREMLLIGERSIDWMVLANYIVDWDFLLDAIPEMVSIPHLVVFYGMLESSHDPSVLWPRNSGTDSKNDGGARPTLDLICLRPSDPRESRNNPLPHSIPYGVHHSKLFLIGYRDDEDRSWCRVVIHTANLRHSDVHRKAQAAYMEDFPLKERSAGIVSTSEPVVDSNNGSLCCDYEETLIDFVDSYQFHQRRDWLGSGASEESISQLLRRFDFSSSRAVLIPSVPGYHELYREKLPSVTSNDNTLWWMKGHWKLRHAAALYTNIEAAPLGSHRPIVCQFSSIGSLSEIYLRELQISMDTHLARTSLQEAIFSNFPIRLQLVYPTVNEIRNSIEGYRGGASVPGTVKNVSKTFLKPLWRKWSTSRGVPQNPMCKPNHVPHIKSYSQINSTGDGLEYLVISSHNLSKAAWGEVQLSRGTRKLFIRHWELGVFLSPTTLKTDRLVVWNGAQKCNVSDSKATDINTIATVPMPFQLFHPERYDDNDEPWAVDKHYREVDRFGFHSTHE
jgi:tyrosyl-DNA phosphodiesterase 1